LTLNSNQSMMNRLELEVLIRIAISKFKENSGING
jgi:hypothetical protein